MPIRRCEKLTVVGVKRGRGRRNNWGKGIREDMAQLRISEC